MQELEDWKARGQFQKISGFDIWVTAHQASHKDTILLVHGFPTFSYDWAPIWDDLAAKYNLLAADMLGFGLSEKPYPHHYSIQEQADIIDSVAVSHGKKSYHILAHDYGDTVVQELLARFNQGELSYDIQSVCFLNGGLFPETHQALLIQKLLLGPLGPLVNKLTTKKRFNYYIYTGST